MNTWMDTHTPVYMQREISTWNKIRIIKISKIRQKEEK